MPYYYLRLNGDQLAVLAKEPPGIVHDTVAVVGDTKVGKLNNKMVKGCPKILVIFMYII